jgi:hypothetical protein
MSGRALTVVAVFGLSLLVGLPRAEAQRRRQAPAPQRTPAEGMWAVGGSVGVAAPTDASLSNGFDLAGNVEGYLTSRVSVRGQLSGAWWDVVGRGFSGTISPFVFDGNLVYNWEGGKWHPYVTGGVGAYRYGSHIDGGTDGGDTKFGGDFGGGVEYFFTRRSTITGEGLYHAVGAFNSPAATFDGSFWTFRAGLKHYF